MSEPDFLTQTGEPMTSNQRWSWNSKNRIRMRKKGAAWFRHSMSRGFSPPLHLIEGWKEKPKHYPPPRFQLTHAGEKPPYVKDPYRVTLDAAIRNKP